MGGSKRTVIPERHAVLEVAASDELELRLWGTECARTRKSTYRHFYPSAYSTEMYILLNLPNIVTAKTHRKMLVKRKCVSDLSAGVLFCCSALLLLL